MAGATRRFAGNVGQRARAMPRSGARHVSRVVRGGGSAVGILVTMVALAILYVALTKIQAVVQLMDDITTWVAKFGDPTQPLI